MNELVISENLKNKIYSIRGVQVMLDSDLAILYQVETKRINEAVKNNLNKFPNKYCFRISEYEFSSLKAKILTSKGGSRKGHNVFTEYGVYMLATILKGNIATKITLLIMDTFIEMKKYISNMYYYNKRLINVEHDIVLLKNDVSNLFNKFDEEIIPKDKTFYNGEIFDAYELICKIINSANKRIIIIDNYLDKTIFKYIRE